MFSKPPLQFQSIQIHPRPKVAFVFCVSMPISEVFMLVDLVLPFTIFIMSLFLPHWFDYFAVQSRCHRMWNTQTHPMPPRLDCKKIWMPLKISATCWNCYQGQKRSFMEGIKDVIFWKIRLWNLVIFVHTAKTTIQPRKFS